MRRMPSSAQRNQTRRAQPVLEGLEDRRLLSHVALRHSIATRPPRPTGVFSDNDHEVHLHHPDRRAGDHSVVGLGNLAGTNGRPAGAAQPGLRRHQRVLEDRRHVNGGDGRAPLASILNSQLIAAVQRIVQRRGRQRARRRSTSSTFDLVAGGNINLTLGREYRWCSTRSVPTLRSTSAHFRQLPSRQRLRRRSSTLDRLVTTPSGSDEEQ